MSAWRVLLFLSMISIMALMIVLAAVIHSLWFLLPALPWALVHAAVTNLNNRGVS